MSYLKYIVKGLLIIAAAQISLKIYRVIDAPDAYRANNPFMNYTGYWEKSDNDIWLLLLISFFLLLVLLLIKYY